MGRGEGSIKGRCIALFGGGGLVGCVVPVARREARFRILSSSCHSKKRDPRKVPEE